MAGSNVSAVVNYIPTVNEGFTTTLGSTITSGATTVPLAGITGLTNGTIFVGIIEPGATNQQVFTGTVDTGGSQVTGVKWTRGTNVGHIGGVAIVDYVTGTAFNMLAAGFLKQHTQTGAHGAVTATSVAVSGNETVGGTLGVTGTATHSGASVLTGAVSGAGYTAGTIANPFKFSAYRNGSFTVTNGTSKVAFDAKLFDTSSNFDEVTNHRAVATIAGYYFFTGVANWALTANNVGLALLYKNGVEVKRGSEGTNATTGSFSFGVSGLIQLAIGDYVEMFITNGSTSGTGSTGANETYLDGIFISAT